jgi:hypothetical protein
MSFKGDVCQPAQASTRLRSLYGAEGVYESRAFALTVARNRRRNKAASASRRRNRGR